MASVSDSPAAVSPNRLLVAASGTGGHLFPAIATAEQLSDVQIEWLGVPDRLETKLVPSRYPLHTIAMRGLQKRLSVETLKTIAQLASSVWQVRQLLRQGQFQAVFTTGGYISAPAILAARSLGLPVVLHESNALPGKVTRWLGPWCSLVAVGYEATARYLPRAQTMYVGTPVRSQFRDEIDRPLTDLSIPLDAPLIVVVGGSQGAVSMNRLVRQCAPAWLEAGAWIVHQTGENDPEAQSLSHPHYLPLAFYNHMAALMQRADLVISRAGAATLTELAVTHTPAILIPYPYAAEDHQTYNAQVFVEAGAAQLYQQDNLTAEVLQQAVLNLLQSPAQRQMMADAAGQLAIVDSAEKLAALIRQVMSNPSRL